jgi:hypothetical protein
MKKGRNTAEILGSDGELDDIELLEGYSTGRKGNKVHLLRPDQALGRGRGI